MATNHMPTKSKPKRIKPSRHFNLFWHYPSLPAPAGQAPDIQADRCPYCQSREVVKEKYRPRVKPSTLTKGVNELAPPCLYARFRDLAQELYRPHQVFKSITLTTNRFTNTATTRLNPLVA